MKLFLDETSNLGLSWFRIYLADSLAEQYLPEPTEEQRLTKWLILHLGMQAGSGHMRTDLGELSREMMEWYLPPETGEAEDFDPALPSLLAENLDSLLETALTTGLAGRLDTTESVADSLPQPRPPLVLSCDGRYLYFLRRRREEDRLIARLSERCLPHESSSLFPLPANFPGGAAGELLTRLNRGGRLLILSGGPGTGKTTTVSTLLRLVSEGRGSGHLLPLRILLAAPTGRAAARMGEAIADASGVDGDGENPSLPSGRTLHSLLGMAPGRAPKHDADNPLAADLVIVDEASMVDLPMMNLLLDALPPAASLILVGDPDQLPSVEAGALLADLLDGAEQDGSRISDAVVRLTRVYRSATGILEAAAAVRDGDLETLFRSWKGDGVMMHPLSTPDRLAQLVADEYRPAMTSAISGTTSAEEDFEAFSRLGVLTPLRKGSWGVPAMNERISFLLGGRITAFAGMPVMVTGNDPGRGLWNGDRGVIRVKDGRLRAFFPSSAGPVDFPLAALPGWEPAWVQTIHKSQGSEFERIIILLPPGADKLLTREILYTGLTRARKNADLYSDDETIAAALSRRVVRNSRIRGWAAENGISD